MRKQVSGFKRSCSCVLVGSLIWSVSGGAARLEAAVAQRDPKGFLSRAVDDPRLQLSSAERRELRRAIGQANGEVAPGRQTEIHPERRIVQELGALAAKIEIANKTRSSEVRGLAAGWVDDMKSLRARVRERLAVARPLRAHEDLPTGQNQKPRFEDKVESEMARIIEDLERVSSSTDGSEALLESIVSRLRSNTDVRKHQRLDPKALPFRAARRTAPMSLAVGLSDGKSESTYAAAVESPLDGDLGEYEEVQITPEIETLAASLGGQPVAIFNWVRNNIEFWPTYGSVQGSQMTLDMRRGNAFDTSSLLIALLRASGIAARFATGTIEVPTAAVLNWVGGAPTPQIAQSLLGQGGIPTVAMVSGGSIVAFRISHAWVEAYVDYVPSRGAVNLGGDSWVRMDAAFKQYDLPSSPSFAADNPLNVLQPGDHLYDFDASLGRFSHVNDGVLDERFDNWATNADLYALQHGLRTPVDLLRGKAIVQTSPEMLAGTLPYKIVTSSPATANLPDGLRHYVQVVGYASELDRMLDERSFTSRISLPTVNTGRLGLQFPPASPADAAILQDAIDNHASAIPVNAINVRPTVSLDAAVEATGSPVNMGSDFFVDIHLDEPGETNTVPYQIVAGDDIVIGVTGNGVNEAVVQKRFSAHPVNNAPEYYHQIQLNYWLQTDSSNRLTSQTLNVFMLRLPSVALASSPLTVSYLFGMPWTGVYQSRSLDVRRSLLGAAGSTPQVVTAFQKQAGFVGSYMEGAVFDRLEDDPNDLVRGFSTIQLLHIAILKGIPVYVITSANLAAVLPLLTVAPEVKDDISSAVAQGRAAMVSESNVQIGSWSGVGYILRDESTGEGAYLISGGVNGGGLAQCVEELVASFVFVLTLILIAIFLWYLLGLVLAELAVGAAAGGLAEGFAYFLAFLRGMAPALQLAPALGKAALPG